MWGYGLSRSSDTIVGYTRPILDEDSTVLVVGGVDPHLFLNGDFVCWVGPGACRGDDTRKRRSQRPINATDLPVACT